VRVGTIDDIISSTGEGLRNGGLRPHAHLFVGKEAGWMDLENERVYEEMGMKEEYWSEVNLERFKVVMSNQVKKEEMGV
jgi:hypothetical protein